MKFYDSGDIEGLLDNLDISTVIGGYLPLIKKGVDFIAKCPFHNDTKPSMSISSSKQIFKCFSCGHGGNAINFVCDYEKINFREAIESLSKKYGLPIKGVTQTNQEYKATSIITNEKKKILECLHKTAVFFIGELKNNQDAFDYIKKRNISSCILERFSIGFAPDKFCKKNRKDTKCDLATLEKAGLINANNGVNKFYNRIMFPIKNHLGKEVGFGGRVIDKNALPKYLNSPETVVFKKSNILYGVHEMLGVQRRNSFIWIVEGYMDVIAMHGKNTTNVLASMGTAVSDEMWKRAFSYTKEVVLFFDGDTAGRNAIKKAVRIGLKYVTDAHSIRVAFVPDGCDPADLADSNSSLDEFYDNAFYLSEYLFNHYTDIQSNVLPETKARLASEVMPLLGEMQDSNVKTMLISELGSILKNNIVVRNGVLSLSGHSQSNDNSFKKPFYPLNKKQNDDEYTRNSKEIVSVRELVFILLQNPSLVYLIKDEDISVFKEQQDTGSKMILVMAEEMKGKQDVDTAFIVGMLSIKGAKFIKYIDDIMEIYRQFKDAYLFLLKEEERVADVISSVINNFKKSKKRSRLTKINEIIENSE